MFVSCGIHGISRDSHMISTNVLFISHMLLHAPDHHHTASRHNYKWRPGKDYDRVDVARFNAVRIDAGEPVMSHATCYSAMRYVLVMGLAQDLADHF